MNNLILAIVRLYRAFYYLDNKTDAQFEALEATVKALKPYAKEVQKANDILDLVE